MEYLISKEVRKRKRKSQKNIGEKNFVNFKIILKDCTRVVLLPNFLNNNALPKKLLLYSSAN